MSDKIFPSGTDIPPSQSESTDAVGKPRLRAAHPAGIIRRATGTGFPVEPVTELPASPDISPDPSNVSEQVPGPVEVAPQTPVTGDVAGTTDEDVSKIRDILFGGQMREYEGRFRNLEEHLTRESERMRDDTERRFSRLEMYIREEFGKLSSRIQHESMERTANAAEIEKNIAAAESHMTSLVHTLDGDLKSDYQDVRRNLYEQGLELEEKLRSARAELTDVMQSHSRQLQDDKLGREMMAGLLDDLAVRLRGEHD